MFGFPNKLGTIVKQIAIWETQKEAENNRTNRAFALFVKQVFLGTIHTNAIIRHFVASCWKEG